MKIIIRKDGQFFRQFDFFEEVIIGRATDTDIQLLHEDISRKHVKVTARNGQVLIQDLGSKNGTLFHGARIEKKIIQEGEIFFIGPFSLSVEQEAPQSQRTVVEYKVQDTFKEQKTPAAVTEKEIRDDTRTSLGSIRVENQPSPPEEIDDDDFPEVEYAEKYDRQEDQRSESASFLDQISVAPSSLDRNLEQNLDGLEEDDEHDTSPYKSVPEYLKKSRKAEDRPKPKNDEKTEVLNPITKPHDSLKDLQLDDEAEIKTQIRPADDVDDGSTKDFPSATENQEDHAEQFFLNRDIDDGHIAESFDNFPVTNKISPNDNYASSFDPRALKRAQENEDEDDDDEDGGEKTDPRTIKRLDVDERDDDEISTGSFTAEQKKPSPKEDQIKTFFLNERDAADISGSGKVDPFGLKQTVKAGIFERIFAVKRDSSIRRGKKSNNRRGLYIAGSLILLVIIGLAIGGSGLFHGEPVDPETAISSQESFEKLGRSEKKRVILFQIDQVQKLVSKKELKEADSRMRKLMTLATKDPDFIQFEKIYQRQRDAIVAEEDKKKKDEEEKIQKRNQALKDASEMINAKQFNSAKKIYTRLLDTFPDDPDIEEKIQTVELLQEQEERVSFAKKQRSDMLTRIFNEGVQKYESGQVGLAQKLFKQVTSERGHPKYQKAQEYLGKVDTMADKKIDQKVSRAKDMIQNPDTLIQGYNELKKITAQFPLRTDAKKYFNDAKTRMDKKARELYADGLAQEELAGDPAAALELYREVLKYAPDKSNRYNQKASDKISSLQL